MVRRDDIHPKGLNFETQKRLWDVFHETHLEVGFYPDEFVSVSDVVDMVIQDFVFEIVSQKPGSTFDAEAIGVTAV